MRPLVGTLLAVGALVATVGFNPTVGAQGPTGDRCPAATAESAPPTGRVDGSGLPAGLANAATAPAAADFFADDTGSIAIHSVVADATSRAAVRQVRNHYAGSSVRVVMDPSAATSRAVVIDGDIGVPGHPTVFSVGGVQTLYLHMTTADADVRRLLDGQSFHTIAVRPEGDSAKCEPRNAGAMATDVTRVFDGSTSPSAPTDGLTAAPPSVDTGATSGAGTAVDGSSALAAIAPTEVLAYIDRPAEPLAAPVLGVTGAVTAGKADDGRVSDRSPSGPGTGLIGFATGTSGVATASIALAATAAVIVRRRDRGDDRGSDPHEDRGRDAAAEHDQPDVPRDADEALRRWAPLLRTASEPGQDEDDAETASELPRVIVLDTAVEGDESEAGTPPAAVGRVIDLHAARPESPLARLVERAAHDDQDVLLSRQEFAHRVSTEWARHRRGGENGAVASLVLSELDAVRLRLGGAAADRVFAEVAQQVSGLLRPLDRVGLAGDNELAILMPDLDEEDARKALDDIARKIAATSYTAVGERVLVTPATGFAMLSDTDSATALIGAVEQAREMSMLNLHLAPERWDRTATAPHATRAEPSRWFRLKKRLRTPVQIAATFVVAWVVPFFFYVAMDAVGLDISFLMYLFFVASLVITGAFILAEGMMARRQAEPPELPDDAFPKATALIAAYLPNEAATVMETIEAFLAIDYPNELQIILAYNTPDPMPVEEHLDRIAERHPNFVPVRIVGSNSKAQNVNAALSMADGEFIGMFDADHQPRPDAFRRAWRWIAGGYDVVQGHCLTRNGDSCWLAKMVAVEFEAIYAVAHPGRAKMHRFGVFGGSNGFWRTELLHETRMRGSMLTEDIDSSMRVVERGFKIRSDRDLVSRELATTTFTQIWNQRMRWAQGWFQVSIEHVKLAFRSKELTIRQKLGIFHLLMWREIYPWLSQQLFPLLAFWALRAGGLGNLDWTIPIFVATSIFTFSVGPLQTLFAYKLADPEIKQHRSWFWGYLLFTTPFYTEYKNLIARVAHIKQFMGESDWRVTPRSADPA